MAAALHLTCPQRCSSQVRHVAEPAVCISNLATINNIQTAFMVNRLWEAICGRCRLHALDMQVTSCHVQHLQFNYAFQMFSVLAMPHLHTKNISVPYTTLLHLSRRIPTGRRGGGCAPVWGAASTQEASTFVNPVCPPDVIWSCHASFAFKGPLYAMHDTTAPLQL